MALEAVRRVIRKLRGFDAAPAHRQCQVCRWFDDDREQVERELPGLLVLSSGFGDSWGDAGLCRKHGLMLLPFNSCPMFEAEEPTGIPNRPAEGSSSARG